MAMAVAEAKRGSAGTTRVGHSGTVRCNGRREVRKRRTRSEPRAGVTKETTADVVGSNEGGEEHRMLLRVDDEAALVRANGRTGAQRAVSRSFQEADTLFIDAYTCGIAGDMLCAALLNLGVVPLDVIERGLRSLASEFTIHSWLRRLAAPSSAWYVRRSADVDGAPLHAPDRNNSGREYFQFIDWVCIVCDTLHPIPNDRARGIRMTTLAKAQAPTRTILSLTSMRGRSRGARPSSQRLHWSGRKGLESRHRQMSSE